MFRIIFALVLAVVAYVVLSAVFYAVSPLHATHYVMVLPVVGALSIMNLVGLGGSALVFGKVASG